jgi:hypothetical protein
VVAIVVGLVVLLVGGNDGGGDGASTIMVASAVDASVSPGQALREGAVVETGPAGSCTVGGETIGPWERAVVRRGRLERRQIPETLTLRAGRLPRGARRCSGRGTRAPTSGATSSSPGSRVRGAVGQQDELTFVDRLPRLRSVRYVVVVLDAANHAVARSNGVRE